MASYESTLRTLSLNADSTLAVLTGPPGAPGSLTGANIAGNQYRFVVVTGVGQVGLANAANAKPVGVLLNKPQYANNASTIGFSGVSKVMTSTTITAGQVVYLDATGRGSNVSANATAVGVALDTTTVATGSVIPVLLQLAE